MSNQSSIITDATQAATNSSDDWRNILVFSILVILLGNLLIFFLFFSARLFGLALSAFVNAFILKNTGELSVKSLQISLIKGRLCICGVSFGSSCLAFRFVDAVIAINWWGSWSEEVPWIFLTITGLEYSILNYSSQYDRLAGILGSRQPHNKPPEQQVNISTPEDAADDASLPNLFWLSKTIKLKIESGCLRIGNNSLPTVLSISFSEAEGSLSYMPGREPPPQGQDSKAADENLDYQRIVLELILQDASIDIKENRSFMPDTAEEETSPESERPVPASYGFHGLINIFKDIGFPSRADSSIVRTAEDEDIFLEDRRSDSARSTSRLAREQSKRVLPGRRPAPGTAHDRGEHVLSSSLIRLRYYDELVRPRAHEIIDLPERGVFLDVLNGSLVYGPWENRQRALIQRHFLPPDFEQRVPYRPATNGGNGPQAKGGFRFGVDFRSSVVLRVPYAESGPGGRVEHVSAHERTANAAGWLSLSAGIDQVVIGSQATTAVKHGVAAVAGGQQLAADILMSKDASVNTRAAKQSPLRPNQRTQQTSFRDESSRSHFSPKPERCYI
jgi:hypothetical protein